MISAINFNGKTMTGFIKDEKNAKGERVVIMEKPKEGILHTTIKSAAYARKGYIATKEGLFGFISAIGAGLVTGGSVMGLGWLFNKVGKGEIDSKLFTTPFKTAGHLVSTGFKKLGHIFNKSVADIIKYPFVKFPKEVAEYVSKHSCNKFGKFMTYATGLTAATVVALGTLIKINKAMADVDHGFKVGHNK